jgi:hypothetical protein
MTQRIGGNAGLPYPQSLYPTELFGAPPDCPTNKICLAPGDTLPIPAGDWFVNLGQYCFLQFLDPITNVWSMGPNAAWQGGHQFVVSDGFNVRAANMTGCPLSATVTAPGDGNYVQATTTITAKGGTSTWVPIIGGALGGLSLIAPGAGYGVAPEVFIPAPPPASNNANGVGGIPASAQAFISSGTVSGVTFTNPGAGYPSGVTLVLVPSANDPNLSSGITNATVSFSLVNAGSITGVLCTNPGVAITPANITLTVTGAGANGTVTANVLQTVTLASVTGFGLGYGTSSALLTTVGGVPSTGSISQNPEGLGLSWRPRPAQIGLAVTGATGSLAANTLGTIYDGGLFLCSSAPGFVIATQPTTSGSLVSLTAATIALTMGSRADNVTIQPAP